jgi:hypothetical protein
LNKPGIVAKEQPVSLMESDPAKKYRLWTFQSVTAVEELKRNGILEAPWDRYSPRSSFFLAYQWMAKQMVARNIPCENAPIWAWHSCTTYECAPRLVDARSLLSDLEIGGGIQTIEFDCPAELALLSRYGMWNSMLFDVFPCASETKINKRTLNQLFATDRKQFKRYDSIQATLPYLKSDWVIGIRELNLKPGDFGYDPDEEI